MTYALGIDLGTTYTAAAVSRAGRAEVAALGYRATSVPTVVFLTEEGRFLVGDAAERRAGTAPDRVAREFKRRVGDTTPLLLGGSPIAVDRCLAEVLRWVATTVGETEGGPPGAVTVTHPANWGEFKRDVLWEALRLADIPRPRLLAEPVAAATWYAQAQRLAPGQTVAVYDLGGGTFDAAVLRRRPDGQFETLGRTEGIERLGGIDVDQAVLGHVLRSLGDRIPGLSSDDRSDVDLDPDPDDVATVVAMAQLREACVEAKEALSSETSVTIPVWLPGLHHQVLLRRTELEDLVGPMLRPTVDALGRVVASAGLRPSDLHAVLLVGGSSRIPVIARQVSAGLGRPIAVDAHPKHPVALGAAIDASAHLTAVAPAPAAAGGRGGGPAAHALAGGRGPAATGIGTGPSPYAFAGSPAPGPGPGTQLRAPWLAGPAGSVQDAPSPFRGLPPPRVPHQSTNANAGFRAAWILSVAVTLIVAAVSIYFVVQRGRAGLDETATGDDTSTVPQTPGPASPSGDDGGDSSGSDTPSSTNLFANAQPALEGFATIYGAAPHRVRTMLLYDTYAFAELQVPSEPTHVDEYEYRDGQLDGPEPVSLIASEPDELEQALFDLAEINPTVIASVVQQPCPGDGLALSHVNIERDLVFDDQQRVLIYVYASNERSEGGYVTFTLDGTLVEQHCD